MITPPTTAALPHASTCDRPDKAQQNKFEGLDFLRAIFSVMVVVLHANLFVVLTGKLKLTALADALNANVGYLAVPVFFQISLFLFFLKSEKTGHQYFLQKRLPKLVSLYLFWVISKLIFDATVRGKSDAIEHGFSSLINFIWFIIIKGGNSAFYFFFSLIFITTLAQLLIFFFEEVKHERIKTKVSYYFLFGSCVLIASFPIVDLLTNRATQLAQVANPLNFLPYLFTASIAAQEFKEEELQQSVKSVGIKLWSLLALFLLFTIVEWSRLETYTHYSRLSLVFGSWLLLYLALLSTQKAPAIVKFISGCSLGIYGFHVFFVDHTHSLENLSRVVPGLGPLTKFLVALIGAIALTLLFRRIKILRSFV